MGLFFKPFNLSFEYVLILELALLSVNILDFLFFTEFLPSLSILLITIFFPLITFLIL